MAASSRFAPPTGRSLGHTVAVLVVGFAVLCTAVVDLGWLLTHPLASTMRGENDVNRWFADQRGEALTHVADGGTLVGETVTGLVVLAALGAAFAVWRRTWWPLVFVAVLDAGLGLFYLAGTTLDPRPRPPVRILSSGLVADASFPSGHTGTATAIGGVLAALLWAYTRVARWALALIVAIPAYTMLSRLYVGAHHVSDVLTAFVYAALWLLLCARMLLPARTSPARQPLRLGLESLGDDRQQDGEHHGEHHPGDDPGAPRDDHGEDQHGHADEEERDPRHHDLDHDVPDGDDPVLHPRPEHPAVQHDRRHVHAERDAGDDDQREVEPLLHVVERREHLRERQGQQEAGQQLQPGLGDP
jgi:undecaprenyl-diphosphatase